MRAPFPCTVHADAVTEDTDVSLRASFFGIEVSATVRVIPAADH